MGNCNSDSSAKQKCTGCGIKKCDCTAGLDSVCGRCDKSWKYQIPGTYDSKYNAWIKANPRPVKPIFEPQPPLNSMDFVCTQCVQCQDFSGITSGGSLDIKDPTQVMQCIGKMKDKQEAEAKAAEAALLKAAAAASAPLAPSAQAAPSTQAAPPTQAAPSESSGTSQMMIIIFMMVLLLVIIIAVVLATRGGRQQNQTAVDTRA